MGGPRSRVRPSPRLHPPLRHLSGAFRPTIGVARSLTALSEVSRHVRLSNLPGMPDDHEQIVVRRNKLRALQDRGAALYPNDFRPDHTAAEVHARFGSTADADFAAASPVVVAGRIMALRDFGKAAFVQLQDRTGRIQVHVRRDRLGDDAFEQYRLLDLGDVVGIAGPPSRPRPGARPGAGATPPL